MRRKEREHTLFQPPELKRMIIAGPLQLGHVALAFIFDFIPMPFIPFTQDALKR